MRLRVGQEAELHLDNAGLLAGDPTKVCNICHRNGSVGKSTPSPGCALGLFVPGSVRAACWSQPHQCLQLPFLLFPASHSILAFLIAQSGIVLFP